MSDEGISLDEKRVYGEKTGTTELYVAAELGVAVVAVSADIVGEFSLAHRCAARDVAAGPEFLAVATDEDVLVSHEGSYADTDFGPAVAVGFDKGDLLAAGPDGRVARREDQGWTELGTVADVRAIDGGLLGAADGIYRVGDGLEHVGLSDVRDVATGGTPLAATGDGLYYLGPGWAKALDGAFTAAASAPDRGHAATADALYEHTDDEWSEVDVPTDEPIAAVAHGPEAGAYAVTERGTVLVSVGDGWRDRALGLPGVSAVAVAPES
ncbi:HVO_0234 family beta-propeller protein [Halorientalis halophila]|uniref:HVO_0234 family beta-propeller protein n=1 Tax=Halorientalis halophila TaxID=3108499 RepID=UPI00300AAA06